MPTVDFKRIVKRYIELFTGTGPIIEARNLDGDLSKYENYYYKITKVGPTDNEILSWTTKLYPRAVFTIITLLKVFSIGIFFQGIFLLDFYKTVFSICFFVLCWLLARLVVLMYRSPIS